MHYTTGFDSGILKVNYYLIMSVFSCKNNGGGLCFLPSIDFGKECLKMINRFWIWWKAIPYASAIVYLKTFLPPLCLVWSVLVCCVIDVVELHCSTFLRLIYRYNFLSNSYDAFLLWWKTLPQVALIVYLKGISSPG